MLLQTHARSIQDRGQVGRVDAFPTGGGASVDRGSFCHIAHIRALGHRGIRIVAHVPDHIGRGFVDDDRCGVHDRRCPRRLRPYNDMNRATATVLDAA